IDQVVRRADQDYAARDKILINISNVGSFGGRPEAAGLFSLVARWHAARHRLPMIRGSRTGYSELIAPWGEVVERLPPRESSAKIGMLPVRSVTH
ncbi:MAG: hypothetical protein DCC75_09645, partial [Proteobacteria bacterium]